MPLHSFIELQLDFLPHRTSVLHNAIHGLIHYVLSCVPSNNHQTAAARLHDNQRQALSLRGFELQHNRLRLEIISLTDDLALSVQAAFDSGLLFGQEMDVLQGRIVAVEHRYFYFESLFEKLQVAPNFLRLEFLSPTAFTHKKGTWASPHPTLLFDGLLARWEDFGGKAMRIDHACIVRAVPHIETAMTDIGANPMQAFIGKLDLELVGESEKCLEIATLAAFGCIVNAGRRVAYGCGAMRGVAELPWGGLRLEPEMLF